VYPDPGLEGHSVVGRLDAHGRERLCGAAPLRHETVPSRRQTLRVGDGRRATASRRGPGLAGSGASGLTDVVSRPVGRLVLEATQGPIGEGWGHDMPPGAGIITPTWQSTLVKRVTLAGVGQRVLDGA